MKAVKSCQLVYLNVLFVCISSSSLRETSKRLVEIDLENEHFQFLGCNRKIIKHDDGPSLWEICEIENNWGSQSREIDTRTLCLYSSSPCLSYRNIDIPTILLSLCVVVQFRGHPYCAPDIIDFHGWTDRLQDSKLLINFTLRLQETETTSHNRYQHFRCHSTDF